MTFLIQIDCYCCYWSPLLFVANQAKIHKNSIFIDIKTLNNNKNTHCPHIQRKKQYHISNCKYTSSECFYLECFFRCLSLSLWQLIILFLISIVCIGHRHARTRSLNWAVCVHCTIALTHAFILWQTHIHLILILSCISFCAIVLFHFYLCVHIGISVTSVRIYLMNWITHLLAVQCTHKYVCFRIRWK